MINFRNASYHLLEWHMRKKNVPPDTSILQIIIACFYLLLNPVTMKCCTNVFDTELSIKAGKMKKIHLKEDERPHSEVIRI